MSINKKKIDQRIGLSYGPGAFTEEEFREAGKQVVNPDLSGYEFFVESHGTKIYRHYREVSAWTSLPILHIALVLELRI